MQSLHCDAEWHAMVDWSANDDWNSVNSIRSACNSHLFPRLRGTAQPHCDRSMTGYGNLNPKPYDRLRSHYVITWCDSTDICKEGTARCEGYRPSLSFCHHTKWLVTVGTKQWLGALRLGDGHCVGWEAAQRPYGGEQHAARDDADADNENAKRPAGDSSSSSTGRGSSMGRHHHPQQMF